MTTLSDVELALSKSVPQLDGLVARTRDDLSVVSRERDREDIVGVADEATGGSTSVQIPKTDSLIPRSRQSELTIRRDGKILDKMVVTEKRLAGNAIVVFIPIKTILKARGQNQ